MKTWALAEIEEAFRLYWNTGMIREDWDAWADLFTEDVVYEERVLGTMNGRETVRAWIKPLMVQYGEIYGIYHWHQVDPSGSGRVVFHMDNRRDHPSGEGHLDFPGMTVLQYAGDGKWSHEEDYWAEKLSVKCYLAYEKALKTHDARHRERRTRLDWGDGPAWTKGPSSYWEHHPGERPDGL
jgi:hypothetical protein